MEKLPESEFIIVNNLLHQEGGHFFKCVVCIMIQPVPEYLGTCILLVVISVAGIQGNLPSFFNEGV